MNVLKKSVFTIALAAMSGPFQLFVGLFAGVIELIYISTHLPHNNMGDNFSEMSVLGTQLSVLVPPAMGMLGIMSWSEVQLWMMNMSFASIGFCILRQAKALVVDPILKFVTDILAPILELKESAAQVFPINIDTGEIFTDLGVEEIAATVGEVVSSMMMKTEEKCRDILPTAITSYKDAASERATELISQDGNVLPDIIAKESHEAGVKAAVEALMRDKEQLLQEEGVSEEAAEGVNMIKEWAQREIIDFINIDLLPETLEKIGVSSDVAGEKISKMVMSKMESKVKVIVDSLIDIAMSPQSMNEIAIKAAASVTADLAADAKDVTKELAGDAMELVGDELESLLPEGVDFETFRNSMNDALRTANELASETGLTPLLDRMKAKIASCADEYRSIIENLSTIESPLDTAEKTGAVVSALQKALTGGDSGEGSAGGASTQNLTGPDLHLLPSQ